MWASLKNYSDAMLLILRLALGGLVLYLYGWPWLAGGIEKWRDMGVEMGHLGIRSAPGLWGFIAACTASLGSVFFIIGFAFRPACLAAVLVLTVIAIAQYDAKSLRVAANAIELALVMLTLMFVGPGRVSVDKG